MMRISYCTRGNRWKKEIGRCCEVDGGWILGPKRSRTRCLLCVRQRTGRAVNKEGSTRRRTEGGKKEMHREGGRDGWMKDVVFFDSD